MIYIVKEALIIIGIVSSLTGIGVFKSSRIESMPVEPIINNTPVLESKEPPVVTPTETATISSKIDPDIELARDLKQSISKINPDGTLILKLEPATPGTVLRHEKIKTLYKEGKLSDILSKDVQ